jgi:hypothetical protein
MYSGWQRAKAPSSEWINQSTEFMNHVFAFSGIAQNGTILVPSVGTILDTQEIL